MVAECVVRVNWERSARVIVDELVPEKIVSVCQQEVVVLVDASMAFVEDRDEARVIVVKYP
jgi:hypothetical protein